MALRISVADVVQPATDDNSVGGSLFHFRVGGGTGDVKCRFGPRLPHDGQNLIGQVFHSVHVGRITHVARENEVVFLLALHRLEKVVVHAVGDDEDFVATLVRKQFAVRLADDGAHVEIVENGGLVMLQAAVLHIIYRPCDK